MSDPMADLTTDKLVATYLKIRNKIKEHEEEIDRFKEQMQVISDKLLELCATDNMDSIKTPEGTISRRVSSRYWTNDWDAMYRFIQTNNAAFLLEKRINNTALKEFLEDNPELIPPGLQSKREYVISVRKPTAK
jgi:hypothetical protein